MYRVVGALVFTLIMLSGAEARSKRVILAHPDCNVLWPCDGVAPSPRGERIVKAMGGFGAAQKVYTPRVAKVDPRHVIRERTRPLPALSDVARAASGIVAPLAAKVAEIQGSCGSSVISGIRHTYIAGTRHISLHASGKAVDMAGNPGCIYAHLTGWAGGYSTDYGRMAHVHISYDAEGGREMGVRFVHGGGHRHRYAHRRHHRYASAQ